MKEVYPTKHRVCRRGNNSSSSRNSVSKLPPAVGSGHCVQRKVGFEFEAPRLYAFRNYKQFEESNDGDFWFPEKFTEPAFRAGDVLLKANGYELQVDRMEDIRLPYLEVVTEPFEESRAGFERMCTTLKDMEYLLAHLTGGRYVDDIVSIHSIAHHGTLTDIGKETIFQARVNQPYCNMQASIGIDADKLWKFFDLMAVAHPDEDELLRNKRSGARKALFGIEEGNVYQEESESNSARLRYALLLADRAQKEFQFSGQAKGLISLMYFYILVTKREAYASPKSVLSILMRNDFASVFKLLPDKERLEKEDLWLSIFQFEDFLSSGELSEPLYSHGIFHLRDDPDMESMSHLTRHDWIVNIARGKDLLTREHFPEPKSGGMVGSVGALGDKFDAEDGKKKVILELRQAEHPLTMPNWRRTALKVFRFVYAFNHGMPHEYGEHFDLLGRLEYLEKPLKW
ncbi:hypothetical protein FUAX_49510 (plasmid) [Fulvitalea axinellae]|uniref:Uncharacterized protein n=1 Tax=Fulvitalea axinellae TaxID=1182444 RepID=A0AAU9D1I9_9BACT|nr:hypothetical protein FUAX_49510 [Fulvitalea axinellae]